MSKSGQRQPGDPGIRLEQVTVGPRRQGDVAPEYCTLCGGFIESGNRKDLLVIRESGARRRVCRPCALAVAGFFEPAGGGY